MTLNSKDSIKSLSKQINLSFEKLFNGKEVVICLLKRIILIGENDTVFNILITLRGASSFLADLLYWILFASKFGRTCLFGKKSGTSGESNRSIGRSESGKCVKIF